MKAHGFGRTFDEAEDAGRRVDRSRARRINLEAGRVSVDFPGRAVAAPDRQARIPGVPQQPLIEPRIAERLKQAE